MASRKKPARDATARTPLVVHIDPVFASVAVRTLDTLANVQPATEMSDVERDATTVLGLVRDAIKEGIVARMRGDR